METTFLNWVLGLLLTLPFAIIPYFMGYDDGYMKKHMTEKHSSKYPIYIAIAYLVIFKFNPLALIGWLIMFKPLFDYGWSKGNGQSKLYIGTTEFWDRLIRHLGLYRTNKFLWIQPIYFFMICGGYLMVYHLAARYVLLDIQKEGIFYFYLN